MEKGFKFKNRYLITDIIDERDNSLLLSARDELIDPSKEVGIFVYKNQSHVRQMNDKIQFYSALFQFQRPDHPYLMKLFNYGEENQLFYIISEPFQGISLNKYVMKEKVVPLAIKYIIIQQMAEVLGHLHKSGIIPECILPENIFLGGDSQQEKAAIKFYMKALLGPWNSNDMTNLTLLHELSFLSPEGCAIIKKKIDERSNLYSLGILSYWLLTGQHPFSGTTYREIIQKQSSFLPLPPYTISSEIPKNISSLIVKMLHKDPDERFQNADCFLDQLMPILKNESGLFTTTISLKKPDSPAPIGRDSEISIFTDFVQKLSAGKGTAVFISGETGGGKTTLIKHFHQSTLNSHIPYLFVECQHYEKSIPFAGLREAVSCYIHCFQKYDSVKQTSLKSELNSLSKKQKEALVYLHNKTTVLFDKNNEGFIPGKEMQSYIYPQALTDLFLKIAKAEKRLVLCFDDLHLAGEEDLDCIAQLLQSILDFPLLCLCAFLPCDKMTAFTDRIEGINTKKSPVKKIELKSFRTDEIRQLIMQIADAIPFDEAPLLSEIEEASGGNPFIIQGIIENGRITKYGNLLDMLFDKYTALDNRAQEVLHRAAMIGLYFDKKILSGVMNEECKAMNSTLKLLEKHHLIEFNPYRNEYRFVNETIRNFIYDRIPSSDKATLHRCIADLLAQNYCISENHFDEQVFILGYHYLKAENYSRALSIVIQCGRMAYQTNAIEKACFFYSTAMNLIQPDEKKNVTLWQLIAEPLIDIYLKLGRIKEAIFLANQRYKLSTTAMDKSQALCQIAHAHMIQGNITECEQVSREGLCLIGEKLPGKPFFIIVQIIKEMLLRIVLRLFPIFRSHKSIDDRMHLIFTYYYNLTNAFVLKADILNVIRNIFRFFNLAASSKQNGKEMAMGYLSYAVIYIMIHRFKKAKKILDLGMRLTEELEDLWHIAKGCCFYSMYCDYIGEYRMGIKYGEKSFNLFTQMNDITESLVAFALFSHHYLNIAQLKEIETLHSLNEIDKSSRGGNFIGSLYFFYLMVYTRLGEFDKAENFGQMIFKYCEQGSMWLTYYPAHAELGYLYIEKGEYERALFHLEKAESYCNKNHFISQYINQTYIYLAEAHLGIYLQTNEVASIKEIKKQKKQLLKLIRTALNKTKPMVSYYGAALRIQAKVLSSVFFDFKKAEQIFLKSIVHCKKYTLKMEEAIGLYELGCFYIRLRFKKRAESFLILAFQIFTEIGAKAYCQKICERLGIENEFKNPIQDYMMQKKLSTTFKAIQNISSFHSLDTLLTQIIQEAVSISGALRGYIFIFNKRNRKLELKALENSKQDEIIDYPLEIIEEVFQSGKILLSENALSDDSLRDNIIIRQNRIKSLLCLPLVYQEHKLGVCYLDNAYSSYIFDREDTEILNIFMHQAVIAIENIDIFHNNEELFKEKEEQKNKLIQNDKLISLGTMVAAISHETSNLNAPISNEISFLMIFFPYILEMVDQLYKENKNIFIGGKPYTLVKKRIQEALMNIAKSSELITKNTSNLRNLYKNEMFYQNERVHLNEVIQSSIILWSKEIEKAGAETYQQLESYLPSIQGNSQQITQVLINLIINSCHAIMDRRSETPAFKGEISIRSRADYKENLVIVELIDNGIGINKDILQKIEDSIPFISTRLDRGGSGLGCYIIKEIMKKHQGKIKYRSEIGKGTKVTLSFPFTK